jgi:hypothetical protein
VFEHFEAGDRVEAFVFERELAAFNVEDFHAHVGWLGVVHVKGIADKPSVRV